MDKNETDFICLNLLQVLTFNLNIQVLKFQSKRNYLILLTLELEFEKGMPIIELSLI